MIAEGSHGTVTIPVLGAKVRKPGRGSVAWYAGLGAMTAFELIEWPLALVVAVSHAVATNSRKPEVRELGKGAESGG